MFNPTPAGVLENQETLGGMFKLTPPPQAFSGFLNLMFDVQI